MVIPPVARLGVWCLVDKVNDGTSKTSDQGPDGAALPGARTNEGSVAQTTEAL